MNFQVYGEINFRLKDSHQKTPFAFAEVVVSTFEFHSSAPKLSHSVFIEKY